MTAQTSAQVLSVLADVGYDLVSVRPDQSRAAHCRPGTHAADRGREGAVPRRWDPTAHWLLAGRGVSSRVAAAGTLWRSAAGLGRSGAARRRTVGPPDGRAGLAQHSQFV